MKYQFGLAAPVVVEATTEEEALAKISSRLSVISRHLGNGETLASCAPFFALSEADDSAVVTDLTDPIVAARVAAGGEGGTAGIGVEVTRAEKPEEAA